MSRNASERKAEAPVPAPIKVAIIDDEQSMRGALARLLKSAGIEAAVFSSALEFLRDVVDQRVDCVVTDLRMPDLDGLSLQEEMSKTQPHLSLVFITGHGNVPASVKAMKSGAVDFLEKPIEDETLQAASDLGIAEKTVKVHRARVMEKMCADSLADLVRMAERLGVKGNGAADASG
jgi:FixJ family two-component response regulator